MPQRAVEEGATVDGSVQLLHSTLIFPWDNAFCMRKYALAILYNPSGFEESWRIRRQHKKLSCRHGAFNLQWFAEPNT